MNSQAPDVVPGAWLEVRMNYKTAWSNLRAAIEKRDRRAITLVREIERAGMIDTEEHRCRRIVRNELNHILEFMDCLERDSDVQLKAHPEDLH